MGTAGVNVPIYVGEMGSVSSNPGKQSWSITQGLYAGQTLGEMMNAGVVRATWWIGFGNCNEDSSKNPLGNMSSSLYGWQTFGAYNVFSDGPTDGACGVGSGPIGTMSATAQAFNLFKNLAVTGESALSTIVNGDTTNIRAYSATHSGGTALLLFNLNQNQSMPVTVTFSTSTHSSGVTVITYDKAIYDQSNPANAGGAKWADPITADMGAQNLPLTLTLTPWSMNVVIIK
jgi:alpha-L-arabinofuranosidase